MSSGLIILSAKMLRQSAEIFSLFILLGLVLLAIRRLGSQIARRLWQLDQSE